MPGCAGRPFVVTDPGPPLAFRDMYSLATELSVTRVTVTPVPPVALLILAHVIESYVSIVTRFPILTAWFGLREPRFPINYLQPSTLRGSMHILVDDSAAKKSIEEGGLGYRGVCTSLEGMCEELAAWNLEHEEAKGSAVKQSTTEKVARAAAVAAAASA